MDIDIVHTSNRDEADEYMCEGYEPIECSFGAHGSVLGPLNLDHHGAESHREGVAIRAYRDHFGALAHQPRFVVTGDADADATFAIAALCGLLPHPSREREFVGKPSYVTAALTRDVTELAELVNARDTEPFTTLADHSWGATLLLWEHLSTGEQDESAFHAGVDRWRLLTGFKAPKLILDAAFSQETDRVVKARDAMTSLVSKDVGIVESEGWGFDIWYTEQPGTPIIVAFEPGAGQATVGCRDLETAERLLGPGGLKNVFSRLEPKGWGGRETVGGGPRGVTLTKLQAICAAEMIADMVEGR